MNIPMIEKIFAQGVDQSIDLGSVQGSRGIPANLPLNRFLQNTFTLIFSVAALAVLVMMIWGGWEWITSGGNKDKIDAARKRIVNALIGLAILAIAFFVVRVVGNIIGFNILGNFEIPFLGRF